MAANCSAESDAVYEVECVLATRVVNRRRQYLVKWIGYPSNKSTWEPATELKHCSEAVKKFQEKLLQHKKQRLKKKKNSKPAPRVTRKLITRKSAPKKGRSSKRGASVDSAASVTGRSVDKPNTRRDQQSRLKRACVKSNSPAKRAAHREAPSSTHESSSKSCDIFKE